MRTRDFHPERLPEIQCRIPKSLISNSRIEQSSKTNKSKTNEAANSRQEHPMNSRFHRKLFLHFRAHTTQTNERRTHEDQNGTSTVPGIYDFSASKSPQSRTCTCTSILRLFTFKITPNLPTVRPPSKILPQINSQAKLQPSVGVAR